MKIKKKPMIVIVVLILLIPAILMGINVYRDYQYHQTIEFKLLTVGYSLEDIKILEEKLPKEKLEALIDEEHNEHLVGIVREKYFLLRNLDRYLEFRNDNLNMSYSEIIALVNVNANHEWYEYELVADLSKGNLMLVNKFFKLEDDFMPDDIVNISSRFAYEGHSVKQNVLDAFIDMQSAADEAGLRIIINFGFRTHAEQQRLWDREFNLRGRTSADSLVARPGHSEHQTGLAIDIARTFCSEDFSLTEEYQWLLANAYKFGFILRYPDGKQHITGFRFEPWHWRYVGQENAERIFNTGLTFDEYYAFYIQK